MREARQARDEKGDRQDRDDPGHRQDPLDEGRVDAARGIVAVAEQGEPVGDAADPALAGFRQGEAQVAPGQRQGRQRTGYPMLSVPAS